ncbi:phospholipase effector Tle1 domain-containing protein [Paracoccus siganidrum]|uniref:DUF2235 domain-containing protein n=1 Tax=Paracoccus siganidrum TaxID=1276757 RepID=A0A419A9D3_9RHOB|nr:DUF2235 domain-containing protein [Paracoccus siganidrum]RJL18844.1 DUF2235 domain-containing protein [Paracoccus siganidrum]RMC38835.1 DUF2235 domain-containing protein [Paracoccus siganidrum]
MTSLTEIDALATTAAATAGLGGELGNIRQNCPETTLEIGMFFDGTLNNRFNVLSRARQDDSYQNALSNVALLYALYKNRPELDERNACGGIARRFRSLYVEGIGSTAGQADSMTGYAFGTGATGVDRRVMVAFNDAIRLIRDAGGPAQLGKVVFDVFGFSRGAAGARYFVNCVRARRFAFAGAGILLPPGIDYEIRFVGIFDTVAAIGNALTDNTGIENINLRRDQARKIHHITAMDEYRMNFSLNHNLPGGGDSQAMPGAHSDIGGGYRDPGDRAPLGRETTRYFGSREAAEAAQRQARAEDAAPGAHTAAEQVWVDEGWIRANETQGGIRRVFGPIEERIIPTRFGVIRRHSYTEHLMLERPWVRIGLSRVPLHVMHQIATAQGAALLPLRTSDPNYVIPEGLRPHVAAIRSGSLSRAQHRAILRDYGHVSAKTGNVGDWAGHRPRTDHRRVVYANRPGEAV